jgi:F-box-like/MORN repeat
MESFPVDILRIIFNYINARELCLSIQQTCRRWHVIIKTDLFWKSYLGTKENLTSKSWQWLALSKQPFKKPDASGVGKCIHEGSNYSYEGQFKNGVMNGYCIVEGSSFNYNGKSEIYRGNFVNGLSSGYCRRIV